MRNFICVNQRTNWNLERASTINPVEQKEALLIDLFAEAPLKGIDATTRGPDVSYSPYVLFTRTQRH